jgi:hypothetical protein
MPFTLNVMTVKGLRTLVTIRIHKFYNHSSSVTVPLISVIICCMTVATLNMLAMEEPFIPDLLTLPLCSVVALLPGPCAGAVAAAAQVAAVASFCRLLQQRKFLGLCTWKRILSQVDSLPGLSAPSFTAAPPFHSCSHVSLNNKVFPLSQYRVAAFGG